MPGEVDMDLKLENAIAVLERTPATLNSLLRGLPDAWTRSNEGEGTWSAADVVAHLIHAERDDWIPRVRIILEFGETRPFPPFDRAGYIQEGRGKPLDQVLDEFAEARSRSLGELTEMKLRPDDFARRGRHPGLGVVTIGDLLATWAAHDLNHLHQIARVMAHQHRNPVGPFARYLGVMHCTAHGA
jgi:hypothetical protein